MKPVAAYDAGRALEEVLRASAKRYARAADVVADLRETLARVPSADPKKQGQPPSEAFEDA